MTFRPHWLSEGYENLVAALEEPERKRAPVDFDVVIVGSGYGGAVAAARLAGATKRDGTSLKVCVLERGREYVPGTFPRRFADLPGHVRFSRGDAPGPKGRRDGLYDFRIGGDVSALVGSGLGGGSLINAGVAERAHDDVLDDQAWPDALRRDREELKACYARAEAMLEVRPAPADHYAKYFEFKELGARLGVPRARPAAVARHFEDPVGARGDANALQNGQGVWQKPCLECGDCVTGCNVWAKNTLPMNYLARAHRAGAQLYTNVTVSRIARSASGDRWRVTFLPTDGQHPTARSRMLRAGQVFLAAGTFGSTEILMRSRSRRLRLSACLGKRFSTNGDMISVLYGQAAMVNAAPEETTPLGERHVGPTITGMIETRGTRAERVLIEELAIPGALRRVFEEVVTTGASPVQLGRFDWSCHGPAGPDPAAVDPSKVCRSQVFAAMGDDGAAGRLALVAGWERSDGDGAICVDWPDAAKADVFARQDRILSRADGLGALYLRNPLWKPLPEELVSMFSGPQPAGKLFTVHPLGGCPMGEDAGSGVVDDLGRVFDPPDSGDPMERGNVARTHEGLVVLDGSIVPVALGVNPLLTIAALAERAVARIAALRDWELDVRVTEKLPRTIPDVPVGIRNPRDAKSRQPRAAPEPPVTAVRFAETMTADLGCSADGNKCRKLALDVVFDDIRDVAKFLRSGPHTVPIARSTLTLLEDGIPVTSAALKGSVSWMERGKTGPLCRTVKASLTWLRQRALADLCQRWRERGLKGVLALFRNGAGAIAVCGNAGEVRYLRYDLELDADFSAGTERLPKGTRIEGLKTFQYAGGGNPWRQLSELAIRRLDNGGGILGAKKLEVDFEAFFRRFAVQLQVTAQRDQPSAIADLAAIALFMVRLVFKLHFWSFRLPEYEKYDPDRARRRLPQALDGLECARESVRVATKEGPLDLPLTRYSKGKPDGKPAVLLIHGFGASGAQFAHASLPHNLVRHLAGDRDGEGFDVWVAELRTSIALPSSYDQWTLDEVARGDIPAIVQRILALTGAEQIDVVAHCIGSAMFCTAALDGKLQGLIRSAVLLQVGPLITLSPGNRVRGRMAAALRRYMLTDRVDSSVDDRADWANGVLDRVLATYPYEEAEAREHLLCPPWEPKTHIANCNRSAAVFGRLFQHANLDRKTLDLLGDLLGHTNLTTFEQTVHYVFLGRLTDYDATSIYVTDQNVQARFNFPVRFVHGARNDVFDPETTRRSLGLLQQVFGAAAGREAVKGDDPANPEVRRKVLPGYGHLDPLVGRRAHEDVFPWISGFLAARHGAAARPQEGKQLYIRRPIIGPLLGWLRRDPRTGERIARIWCRTDDEQSFGYFLIAVVLDGRGQRIKAYKAPLGTQPRDELGELDRLGLIDVPLPAADDDYEIVVVSAHATWEDPSGRPAQQLASAPATKPLEELHIFDVEGVLSSKLLPEAKDIGAKPLPDRYGDDVVELRKGWSDQVTWSRQARFTCDAGYDESPDSIRVSKRLLQATAGVHDSICFAVGSCRFAASRVDRERADAMFDRLSDLLSDRGSEAQQPSLLLLVGDQIYADATAGMFDPKTRRERFNDSYREAWSAPKAREVLRRIPTYMMLDDHEVADNWHPDDRFPDDSTRNWGETAFREYQLAHSPRAEYLLMHSPGADPDAPPYHYSFESGGFGFFVCDTRTGRKGRSRIMSASQFDELKNWLRERQGSGGDRPKFVVSPSVLAPILSATGGRRCLAPRSDGWDGFPDSLGELASFVADEGIANVVFLCGDPHLSMACGIDFVRADGSSVRAACIVASPLYAPYPFANADYREYLAELKVECEAAPRMRYALEKFVDPDAPAPERKEREPDPTYVAGDSYTLVSARRNRGHWEIAAEVHVGEKAKLVAVVTLG